MAELLPEDVALVVRRLPAEVRALLQRHRLVLAGGWVRSVIGGEESSDVDLFGPNTETLDAAEEALVAAAEEHDYTPRRFESGLAVTISWRRPPVQFVRAWTFVDAKAVIDAFDWTVARAAIWWNGKEWTSVCDERFYADLAARRLVYAKPGRGAGSALQEVGASVLRMLKFARRGYRITVQQLAVLLGEFAELAGDGDERTRNMERALRLSDPLPPEAFDTLDATTASKVGDGDADG